MTKNIFFSYIYNGKQEHLSKWQCKAVHLCIFKLYLFKIKSTCFDICLSNEWFTVLNAEQSMIWDRTADTRFVWLLWENKRKGRVIKVSLWPQSKRRGDGQRPEESQMSSRYCSTTALLSTRWYLTLNERKSRQSQCEIKIDYLLSYFIFWVLLNNSSVHVISK